MTENAKIARLWSGFHHLSENHKDLVLTLSEMIKRPEKPYPDEWAGMESKNGDFHKDINLS